MSDLHLFESFTTQLDARLHWRNPPTDWRLEKGKLLIFPDEKTDFWQKTHYGFAVDNGHFLQMELAGDFVLATSVRFFPKHQYDQAGLMIYISPQFWIKASVEYEPEGPNKLGAVVTRHGYSDWSTQIYPKHLHELQLRIRREADDYIVEYLLRSDGRNPGAATESWVQMRMAHLDNDQAGPVLGGLYACSPIGAGFRAEFDHLQVLV